MKRIIIFDDGPSGDGSGLIFWYIVLGLYAIIAVAIWPAAIKELITTEDVDFRREFFVLTSVVLIICVAITVLYILLRDKWKISFSNAFWIIVGFTTIIAGAIFSYLWSLERTVEIEEFLYVLLVTSFYAGAPSALAACICEGYSPRIG